MKESDPEYVILQTLSDHPYGIPYLNILRSLQAEHRIPNGESIINEFIGKGFISESSNMPAGFEPFRLLYITDEGKKYLRLGIKSRNWLQKFGYWLTLDSGHGNLKWLIGLVVGFFLGILSGYILFRMNH